MFEANFNLVAAGPYLSCEQHPHIQCFTLVLDHRGLQILKKTWRCLNEKTNETRYEWINRTEVVNIYVYCRIKLDKNE